MKLLMITGDRTLAQGKRGAFWNTLSELHKHFDRIDVICPRIPEHRYDVVVFGDVHIHPSPLPLIFQPIWIWWKGRGLIEDFAHDLMTVHSYPLFYNDLGGWFLHRSARIPYVLEIMHIEGWPRAAGPRDLLNRWLRLLSLPWSTMAARAVRVINEQEVPDYLADAGVSRERMRYIPANYIDLETFRPRDLPKKYDLVFVGRLARNKGIQRFLEVVRLTGLKALVVGDGPLMKSSKLKTQMSKLDIIFHGFARDQRGVSELINSARLLCVFSDNEGGPRVALEAMACGTPVLATPVGIVPDVFPPEAIGSWNTHALAEMTQTILNDERLAARLREHGLSVARRFEKRAAIARYAAELKMLIP